MTALTSVLSWTKLYTNEQLEGGDLLIIGFT